MKSIPLVIVLFLLTSLVRSQDLTAYDIHLKVENIQSEGGKILAVLHSAETFMQSEGVGHVYAEGKKGALELDFKNVVPGTYAILVMHDMNGNFQMDFDERGMPKESFGMSGEGGHMGPPSFYQAKFELSDQDLAMTIKL
ncbi:DUF2141 domain-containing protein [Muriicola marianensis]|uniref:DUF2141 domain-containing protein n=1 Tax=Muriicola marianensis TaxID=1324801 RepID=A0ABQ1R553_9FLAO|nr:DUF2141 domain-containing protein [Muriicola marianensis]GGD58579.1 hypothetical protein GCM10011361_26170 [Muriicola marianensis]